MFDETGINTYEPAVLDETHYVVVVRFGSEVWGIAIETMWLLLKCLGSLSKSQNFPDLTCHTLVFFFWWQENIPLIDSRTQAPSKLKP